MHRGREGAELSKRTSMASPWGIALTSEQSDAKSATRALASTLEIRRKT